MISTFQISPSYVEELKNILQDLKTNNKSVDHEVDSVNAFQTSNLCFNKQVNEIIYKILEEIDLETEFYYRWFHMIDYDAHGYQKGHDHSATEDMSYILYLTSCSSGGETVFNINGENVAVRPQQGRLVLFPSSIWHCAQPTVEKKKVAVGALKRY